MEQVSKWYCRRHQEPVYRRRKCQGKAFYLHQFRKCLTGQERPYRQSLSTQDIASILHEKVEQGELDEMIVDIVDENLEQCYEIAIMAPQETKLNF